MALFAQLDDDNNILNVLVIDDEHVTSEEAGIAWCVDFFKGGKWLQTWQDGSKRKNYAAIGSKYNPTLDIFLPSKPYPDFIVNEAGDDWIPPLPEPTTGGPWTWWPEGSKWIPACPYTIADGYFGWNDATQTWEKLA